MIPKKIHYCWLSDEIMPKSIQVCIRSWKDIMPDYELVLWDTNRFNINSNLFVKEACLKKNGPLQLIIFVYMLYIRKAEYIWIQMY